MAANCYFGPGGGRLLMPKIEKAGEFTEWLVWHGGRAKPVGSEAVALADAAYYRREGYTDVRIESRLVPIMADVQDYGNGHK